MTATLQIKKDRPNYYVLIRYRDETVGKERQKWVATEIPVKGNNKRKADEKLKEVLSDFKHQQIDLGKDVLFTVFVKEWLENLRPTIAETTYEAYRINVMKRIVPFYEPRKIRLRDLTPAHVQQYINYQLKSVSANTVRKHLVNMSKCLESAVRQNLIAFNPVKRIDQPKKIKYTGAKFYNETQIEKLLECSKGDPLEIVILLTAFYGFRRSEVLGLKWSAISFDDGTITVNHTITQIDGEIHRKDTTKNESSHSVLPLAGMIRERLIEWRRVQEGYKQLQPNDYVDVGYYVCTQFDGTLIKPNYVSQHFRLLLKQHGLPHIRFHDMRHSAASYLLHLGFNLKEIQVWLRHADIQTTMNVYAHIDLSAKRNIAEGLDEKFAKFAK